MLRRTRENLDGAVRLVVQGDDLGMCHAVNVGILTAYTEGILTQTTAMAPCPWWGEGVAMAMRAGLAVGMHATLTSEWDWLRWRPLTGGRSLCGDDRTFHRSVEEAETLVEPTEAAAEVQAQAEAFSQASCPLTHMDNHMGPVCIPAYQHVCEATGTPFLFPSVTPHLQVGAREMLSTQGDKMAWLLSYLGDLGPGTHVLISHPAPDHPELAAMTSEDDPALPWAVEYRVSDLRCLCAPEVTALIERRDIQLISFRDVAIDG